MSNTWRLLDTGALPAANNMALDKVVITARSRGKIPNTIRFLQFSPHCALVGYHQSVQLEVEEQYCREHGIEINRRITGGGNLYWDEGTLGWEIIAGKNTPNIPTQLEDMYRLMCESAVNGLDRLGVQASFRPKNDIEVGGRKICGTGGTEIGDSFLYQGSLLTDFDVDTMLNCLKLPLKKLEKKEIQSFKQRVTCLKEILGYTPAMADIKKAMMEGFQEILGIELLPAGLTAYEKELLHQELAEFQSDHWIRRRQPSVRNDLNIFDYKTGGGLIRISVRVDADRKLIKSVFITGDFFAYPSRSIMDLENALKNSSSDDKDIYQTVYEFFEQNKVKMPGIVANDFYQAISLAVNRAGEYDEQVL